MMMTYERSSDICVPLAAKLIPGGTVSNTLGNFEQKSFLAVGYFPDCEAQGLKTKLKNFKLVPGVHIMGDTRCANTPTIPECLTLNSTCLEALGKKYKFYLAFEDGDCAEYITSKVWVDSFLYGMVPVVWGKRTGYSAELPPGSFINCNRYPNLSACVSKIRGVGTDSNLYKSFHAWKYRYGLDFNDMTHMEELCSFAIINRHRDKARVDIKQRRNPTRICTFDP